MKKITILLISIFGFAIYTKSQISTEEVPVSFNLRHISQKARQAVQNVEQVKGYELDISKSANMLEIAKEDILDEEDGIPPRFGIPKDVNYTLENSGIWTTLENGDRLWQLPLQSQGALSINILYDKFWLPEGAKFFVYSQNGKQTIGAFTSANNKGTKDHLEGFATELIFSDKVILEYYQPANVKENGIISVSKVVHGYRNIIQKKMEEAGFGQSLDCHNNIGCPEGQNWQREKKAVALIIVDGHRYCSGALLNTAENNYAPIFLTADHCLGGWGNNGTKYDAETNSNLNHWSFYWNYESSNTVEPIGLTTVGAKILANDDDTDFALLQLTEDPKQKYGVNPYYLGWDARENSYGSQNTGVGIHHPDGDVKKISFYNDISTNTNPIYWTDGGVSPINSHWGAIYYSGTTEGGSSGSPLINSDHRVIGQLHGGDSGCPSSSVLIRKSYGRLDKSWLGYNNPANSAKRRLRDWLDRGNITNRVWDPRCSANFYISDAKVKTEYCYNTIYLEQTVVVGGTTIIPGRSCRSTVTFTANHSNLTCSNPDDVDFLFLNRGSGNYYLNFRMLETGVTTFKIASECYDYRLIFMSGTPIRYSYSYSNASKIIKIDFLDENFENISNSGISRVNSINNSSSNEYHFIITNISGLVVKEITSKNTINEISISNLLKGIYILNIYNWKQEKIGSEKFVVN